MAGEHTESEAHGEGTNGVSKSGAGSFASARAAFLAGESGVEEKIESKPVSKPVAREEADDDSDLDENDSNEIADDDREPSDHDDEDPDADLDEDEEDEKSEDKDEDAKTGIDKVRHTEKRMREQLKKERSDAEAEIRELAQRAEQDLEQKWRPRIEAAEKFEKLAQRAAVDPVAAIQAIIKEDAYEHVAQVLYTLAKAKDDPKAKAAAANLMKARERDAELDDLKRKFEEREKADKDRAEQAAADREVEAFMGSVTKAVSDKTPLAKALLKNDAAAARDELQVVAFKLAKESGKLPDAKKVAIAFEKAQRAKLRALGIDPKSRGAAAAIVADSKSETTKAAAKQGEKKPAEKKAVEEKKLSPREAFIRKPD